MFQKCFCCLSVLLFLVSNCLGSGQSYVNKEIFIQCRSIYSVFSFNSILPQKISIWLLSYTTVQQSMNEIIVIVALANACEFHQLIFVNQSCLQNLTFMWFV